MKVIEDIIEGFISSQFFVDEVAWNSVFRTNRRIFDIVNDGNGLEARVITQDEIDAGLVEPGIYSAELPRLKNVKLIGEWDWTDFLSAVEENLEELQSEFRATLIDVLLEDE